MKDELGLYYYPAPNERAVRMYVRQRYGAVEFRMWERSRPEVWEKHGWVPYEDLAEMAERYREVGGGNADPLALYDIGVAERLLKDGE